MRNTLIWWRDTLKARLRRMRGAGNANPPFRLPPSALDRPDGARSGIAIVAIFKDEADYLEEWIEFHAMMGVRAFFLYDNGSTDGGPERLAAREAAGQVRVLPWRSFDGVNGAQRFAYLHGIANFGAEFRWMAFIDVDEFLAPTVDPDLPTALARFEHLPGLSLPWLNFGANNHRVKPEGLVTENYLERAPFPPRPDQWALLRYKTILDPQAVTVGGSHAFGYRGIGPAMFNERGERIDPSMARRPGFATAEFLRLHHYFTRSEEELARKLAKGRVSRNGAGGQGAYDRRLEQYALAVERDETMLRHVPRLKARLNARRDADDPLSA